MLRIGILDAKDRGFPGFFFFFFVNSTSQKQSCACNVDADLSSCHLLPEIVCKPPSIPPSVKWG